MKSSMDSRVDFLREDVRGERSMLKGKMQASVVGVLEMDAD